MLHLTFIHGWGFDAAFWDPLAELLKQYPQARLDRGYFGKAHGLSDSPPHTLLVGHSLGFVHGVNMHNSWAGWIAINSFPRFTGGEDDVGCVPAAALRGMRKNLLRDPPATLRTFYQQIDASGFAPAGEPDAAALGKGLDELGDTDICEVLSATKIPALVLAANNDPLVPVQTSKALAGTKARLHLHPTGGHILPRSDAAWCAEMIDGFIAEEFGGRL